MRSVSGGKILFSRKVKRKAGGVFSPNIFWKERRFPPSPE